MVLGQNGAGKSTLLHALSGLVSPSSGTVTLDGKALSAYHPKTLAKRRTMLSQHSGLSLDFSVEEVLSLGEYAQPFTRAWHDEVVSLVQLEPLLARAFFSLSGGERQRVQLARVLLQLNGFENNAVLLDEPTTHMDMSVSVMIGKLLQTIAARGASVVAVVHDVNFAAQYATDVLLLKAGKAMAQGKTTDIMRANTLAKTFNVALHEISVDDGPIFFTTKC
jgi:iron complex transport system ATP-binding protein